MELRIFAHKQKRGNAPIAVSPSAYSFFFTSNVLRPSSHVPAPSHFITLMISTPSNVTLPTLPVT